MAKSISVTSANAILATATLFNACFVRRTALRCYKRWDVTMGCSLFTLAPYAFVFQRGRRRPARIPSSQRRTLLPVGGRIYDLLTLSNYRP